MNHLTKLLLTPIALLTPTPALAQSEPPPFVLFDGNNAETQKKAFELYRKGRAALDAEDYEKARELSAQAFALDPTWKCAANLGFAEFMLKKYRDSAEHLNFFLNYADRANIEDEIWKEYLGYFKEATAEVVSLTISLNEAGAEVLLDGKSIGFSPFMSVVYVDPGKHIISAKKQGFFETRSRFDAAKGSHANITLKLRRPSPPIQKSVQNPEEPQGEVSSTFGLPYWIPLAVGGGITALGMGMGIGFTLSANDIASRIDDPSNIVNGNSSLESQLSKHTGLAIGGFVGGGLFALGTLLVYSQMGSPSPKRSLTWPQIAPAFAHHYQGVQVYVQF